MPKSEYQNNFYCANTVPAAKENLSSGSSLKYVPIILLILENVFIIYLQKQIKWQMIFLKAIFFLTKAFYPHKLPNSGDL